ncbi:hypothetical protein [Campylobacter vulpis]|uniref:Membrane protein n=1 Tax=Campylobacter vulpis TaxID=1655500 RepID=A0A2G4R3U4_9BACT|nr:hypothetical protein [Campylobacter vulpis]MBS4241225.1 hypothetical protein [Campylobacter vulpis]MBS4252711.1 hypothetical protein [Campylobacter vulpis]MBS4275432.1 hypothetical protein [Campylobacter vulpis]MBS4281980.1 hypothetical protein [Campylobacter vulpis]MBS4306471.1 hypothetical protein [Campylobacter vulpis]
MKIRLFILASLIYIALIVAFMFYLNLGYYELVLGTFALNLPIMLWLIAPLVLYFILALFHISFYAFLRYLKFKHFFKDAAKFEDFTKDLLLEKESKISFYTKEFKQVSELCKSLKNGTKNADFHAINDLLDLLEAIKGGKFQNLNKFKLDKNNPIVLQNEKNHIKNDLDYAYSKLKNLSEISTEFEKLAFEMVLQKGTYEQIKNLKISKTNEQILSLIKRFKDGSLELTLAEFEVLVERANLNENEYLTLAKMCVKCFNPDAIINIFLKIKNAKNEALKAYLYLLAEFSMFEELENQIRNKEELSDFKAVLALREKNIKFDLNRLIV